MDDEPLSLRHLDQRVRRIEDRDIEADLVHKELVKNDGQTAEAVRALTQTLNDPRVGLIVELDCFRAEVVADRKAFRAWIRGAVAVISVIFAIFTVISPWIRLLIETVFRVGAPS